MQKQSRYGRLAHDSQLPLVLLAAAGAGLAVKHLVRVKRTISLAGRVVLVTGGSRGLGLATAREFARQGARVAICARDEKELDTARLDIMRFGSIQTFRCDLSSPPDISRLIADVHSRLGRVDILVNNAGIITVGPLESMTITDFQEAMDVNFWAAVHTSLSVIPLMKSQGGGRIVNIASVGGKMPVPHLVPYSASKFALVGFSGGMRAELLKDNIFISTINPGLMRTGSPRNANFKGRYREEYAWFSIGDATPGLTISAASAARKIVSAAMHGDAEVTLSLPAKLGAKFYGLFPNIYLELSSLATALLPPPGGIGKRSLPGRASESKISRSPVRALGQFAERDLNQLHT